MFKWNSIYCLVFVSRHYRKCILSVQTLVKKWTSITPTADIIQLPLYSYLHLWIREPKRIDFLILFPFGRNDFIFQPTYHKEPFSSSVAFGTTRFNHFFSRNIPVFVTSFTIKMTVKTHVRHFLWLILSIKIIDLKRFFLFFSWTVLMYFMFSNTFMLWYSRFLMYKQWVICLMKIFVFFDY